MDVVLKRASLTISLVIIEMCLALDICQSAPKQHIANSDDTKIKANPCQMNSSCHIAKKMVIKPMPDTDLCSICKKS